MFGKKATEDLLPLIFIMLVVVLLLIFIPMCSVSKANSIQAEINKHERNIDGNLVLTNFLRTPISENENIADLIIKSYYYDDFNEFKKIAEIYFDDVYGTKKDIHQWYLKLSWPPSKWGFTGRYFGTSESDKSKIKGTHLRIKSITQVAESKIPTYSSETITVTLYFVELASG